MNFLLAFVSKRTAFAFCKFFYFNRQCKHVEKFLEFCIRWSDVCG